MRSWSGAGQTCSGFRGRGQPGRLGRAATAPAQQEKRALSHPPDAPRDAAPRTPRFGREKHPPSACRFAGRRGAQGGRALPSRRWPSRPRSRFPRRRCLSQAPSSRPPPTPPPPPQTVIILPKCSLPPRLCSGVAGRGAGHSCWLHRALERRSHRPASQVGGPRTRCLVLGTGFRETPLPLSLLLTPPHCCAQLAPRSWRFLPPLFRLLLSLAAPPASPGWAPQRPVPGLAPTLHPAALPKASSGHSVPVMLP